MTRRLLRIDLTTRRVDENTIGEQDAVMFLGGRVLGDMLLYRELAPGIDPLSPHNKLLFSTGPLTGTAAPGSSRYVVHTKSPLTGLYLSSLAGGHFGPELRKTGYDSILIEGRSETPVYLFISGNNVEFRDAGPFWGMKTGDAQELIKGDLGESRARIACIGPAGENLVPYAAILSERRAAGRGGAGAVMGSKNLKAVAVRGAGKAEVKDPEAFRTAVKKTMKETSSHPLRKGFNLYGSLMAMSLLNTGGIIPWRNWQEAACPEGEELFPENWRKRFVKKDVHCAPPCHFKCGKICLATEGMHAGTLSEGPEYEAEYALGTCCGITDQAAIIEADALCDQYGIDVISMGVSLAFAMECYEKGIITAAETDGREFVFGASALLAGAIRDTAYRKGFGVVLSEGTKRMAERFGKGSEAFAMHAKGMELGGYDPRGAKSVALVYACGPRGGCHKSGGSGNALSVKELQTGDERFSTDGKAALAKASRDDRVLADSAIMCIFMQAAVSTERMAELLRSATGFDYSVDDLRAIGERGSNIERAFNVREGLRRNWDTLPARLRESVKSGPTKEQIVDLETLLSDFYELCGWAGETGIPYPRKLKELGLPEIAEDMERYIHGPNRGSGF